MEEDRKLPAWVLPGLGVLAVIALVAAGLLRETPELDPSTPEGTVQAYLEAVFAGDEEAASQYTEGECDPNLGAGSPTQGVSASLVSVEGDDQFRPLSFSSARPPRTLLSGSANGRNGSTSSTGMASG